MSQSTFVEQAMYAAELARDFVSQTALSQARSFMGGDSQFFSVSLKTDELRRMLDSESITETRDAMKRIVAQMCKGNNMRQLFPDVVRNVHVNSIEVRKLIYHFIIYYAVDCPNEALLSIAAFQKDLTNPSMHVRALALRMLCSLRISAIHPAVMMAVKTCSDDVAPIVRKAAAIALVQMHSVSGDESDMDSMLEVLQSLLRDTNADVVGAATMAFCELWPDRMDLIHPVFRRLCQLLSSVEEWGQIFILRVLLRYTRMCFTDPTAAEATTATTGASDGSSSDADASDSNTTSSSSSSSGSGRGGDAKSSKTRAKEAALHRDHALVLNSVLPLLRSMNSAVVVGAVAIYYHCAPPSYLDRCVGPLIRLFSGPLRGKEVVLSSIGALLQKNPALFSPFIRTFYLLPVDSSEIRKLKLHILAKLIDGSTEVGKEVVREFAVYTRNSSLQVVLDSLSALSEVVCVSPQLSSQVLRLISPLLSHGNDKVVSKAVTVLRLLVAQRTDHASVSKLVFRLIESVVGGKLSNPVAVRTVVWLAGENISTHPSVAAAAPDLFRIFARSFVDLDTELKEEVLLLGLKIWFNLNGKSEMAARFRDMFFFVLEMARFDDAYVIRDQGRLLSCALDRDSESFKALKASLAKARPAPTVSNPLDEITTFELGSLSFCLGREVLGHQEVPKWAAEPQGEAARGNDGLRSEGPSKVSAVLPSSSSSSASTDSRTDSEESTESDESGDDFEEFTETTGTDNESNSEEDEESESESESEADKEDSTESEDASATTKEKER